MQEERNIKWILIVSLILLFASSWLAAILASTHYYGDKLTGLAEVFYYIEYYLYRIQILFFLATITASTLYTAGFGKKDLMYKISVYLFIISMALFSVGILISAYP